MICSFDDTSLNKEKNAIINYTKSISRAKVAMSIKLLIIISLCLSTFTDVHSKSLSNQKCYVYKVIFDHRNVTYKNRSFNDSLYFAVLPTNNEEEVDLIEIHPITIKYPQFLFKGIKYKNKTDYYFGKSCRHYLHDDKLVYKKYCGGKNTSIESFRMISGRSYCPVEYYYYGMKGHVVEEDISIRPLSDKLMPLIESRSKYIQVEYGNEYHIYSTVTKVDSFEINYMQNMFAANNYVKICEDSLELLQNKIDNIYTSSPLSVLSYEDSNVKSNQLIGSDTNKRYKNVNIGDDDTNIKKEFTPNDFWGFYNLLANENPILNGSRKGNNYRTEKINNYSSIKTFSENINSGLFQRYFTNSLFTREKTLKYNAQQRILQIPDSLIELLNRYYLSRLKHQQIDSYRVAISNMVSQMNAILNLKNPVETKINMNESNFICSKSYDLCELLSLYYNSNGYSQVIKSLDTNCHFVDNFVDIVTNQTKDFLDKTQLAKFLHINSNSSIGYNSITKEWLMYTYNDIDGNCYENIEHPCEYIGPIVRYGFKVDNSSVVLSSLHIGCTFDNCE